jgi:hypothetical protein
MKINLLIVVIKFYINLYKYFKNLIIFIHYFFKKNLNIFNIREHKYIYIC